MADSAPRSTSSRLASLVTSVMDLHVRIALQEADREKRRLIVGALLIGTALVLLSGALLVAHGAVLLWLVQGWQWSWLAAFLIVGAVDLLLAGLLLRLGGQLLKGPYLPQTTAGISRTTRTLLGR
ncbi:MAG: phage holin family protein [Synechococcaceae bacterium WBA_2_066]|nr:phage holin family protein [Synechococcaceae bacterium WB6_1A_059]NBP33313.1 phage holin family protein [Synechococcaceae bacterium WB6_1B_055]NBQ19450.1 phage holin family protein [Synechococcaceae bacterium WB5_2A_257]NBR44789.1 phage holin family protein [Synechococcaceae bacterium WB5_2B_268]NBY58855.1 phage holin family protein [Synechococcaceae bacterium LLD_019]NCU76860.1 phage holin family protein [Synechococcaceae bacterium WB7_1C_051]NCU91872.1 phage holin family protein [Synecho